VSQKKKKRKRRRKVKREIFSFRPAKKNFDLCPTMVRKLAWLEDKAEELHVQRMQCGRETRTWTPPLLKV